MIRSGTLGAISGPERVVIPFPARTEARRSMMRETFASESANQSPQSTPSPVDRHMQEWLDAGWALHSLTTVQRGQAKFDLVHVFFWFRDKGASAGL